MSKVDWSKAPEDAEFFSMGGFRKYVPNERIGRGVDEYYYLTEDCVKDYLSPEAFERNKGFLTGRWRLSIYESLHDHMQYSDFELRPKEIKVIDKPEVATNKQNLWTASHYDNYYQLTPEDIEVGKIKIDAYFVNKIWKLNQKDDTGGLFHSLKTIARFGDKNPIERELKALYAQTKRMAELYGIKLE